MRSAPNKKAPPRFVVAIVVLLVGGSVAARDTASALADEDRPQPRIRSVWGDRTNGSMLTIIGDHFGHHDLHIESSIGPDAWIEATPAGTPVGQIELAPDWNTFATKVAPYVDDSRAHSGRNSINASIDRAVDDDWNKILYYQRPPFTSVYASWWVYFEPILYADETQWKMWRVGDSSKDRIASDNCGSMVQSSRWSNPGIPTMNHSIFWCMLGCEWPAMRRCYAQIRPDPWYRPIDGDPFNYTYHCRGGTESYEMGLPTPGVWCRAEVFLQASDPDLANGRYWLTMHKPGRTRFVVDNWSTGLTTHQTSCCNDKSGPWQNFVLHGYFDDDGGTFPNERAEIFYDDIFLQFGSLARVELGDSPDYRTCTHLELQPPTSWTENSIEVTLNHGAFEPGTPVWLFVIDGEGSVSAGMPARIR